MNAILDQKKQDDDLRDPLRTKDGTEPKKPKEE
jgi:hypothetical protein